MVYSRDEQIVRELARRVAEIAHEPQQERIKENWRAMNDLRPHKPMTLIWGGGIPWYEMDQSEIVRECEDDDLANYEMNMKQTLFRHKYLPDDMVVEPWVRSPIVYHDTGIGMPGSEQLVEREVFSHPKAISSRSFKSVLHTEDDLSMMHPPEVSLDAAETDRLYERNQRLFDGILGVRKTGAAVQFFWPWNVIIFWLGIEQTLMLMYDNPNFLHGIIGRFVDYHINLLDQYERLGLIDGGTGAENIGTGGYSYCSGIPRHAAEGQVTRTSSQWVSTAAEIFSCVSPEMHDEFALQYEMKVHSRFGLVSYGCCEPLDRKIKYLRKINNLRTISISAWANVENAASQIKGDYVFSWRPENSSISSGSWNPEEWRKQLRNVLAITQQYGCTVEIIMNAVSTLQGQPKRLLEWAKVTAEETGG